MPDTTVVLAGNTFIAQPITRNRNPRFGKVVELIRAADASICNLECAIPDVDSPPAYMAGTGWCATYMLGTPRMLDDLKFLGISGVCAANNHVSDFGDSGIRSTIKHLRQARLPYAGIGESSTEAAEAAYLDTPSGLRLAFIAVCDWGPRGSLELNISWPVGYIPSDDDPPFQSRPGVNLLRYQAVTRVTREQLGWLRQISQSLGWERDKIYRRNGFGRDYPLVGMTTNLDVEVNDDGQFYFMGRKFELADQPGHYTVPCQEDLARIYKHIGEARRQADLVFVALHDQSHGEHVHKHIDEVAHGIIDAGADVFFNNGGSNMGIEIYKQKAILYGVPTFFLQTEAVVNLPRDARLRYGLPADSTAAEFLDRRAEGARRAFAEGGPLERLSPGAAGPAVYTCRYGGDARLNARLKEIRVQPLEPLGGTIFASTSVPRFRRQLPLMPEPGSAHAERTLYYTSKYCQELGTDFQVEAGVGVVSVA
jgi:poly-gamma-glutamate capsule biosynthesis protein CapA/YwtB (metallophosphatase superfamily)